MENVEKDLCILTNFWDNQFLLTDEEKQEILKDIDKENDWKNLAPSTKLLDACNVLSKQTNILDYGCGNGWASIAIAKYNNLCNITSVDTSINAIDQAKFFSNCFNINNIKYINIDKDWLKNEASNIYDGFICSNVLDVIPQDVTLNLLKEIARVTTFDALIIISFNYYMDLNNLNNPNIVIKENNVYINDVLRMVSLTDNEWINIFSKYFNVEKLEYFSWPQETKETRRLFYLRKK